ncbi:MAG: hypothetical protein H0W81_01595 [Chloroflexi bacterium]|nr:hypothetical protein [Chloroflexota bacterium]
MTEREPIHSAAAPSTARPAARKLVDRRRAMSLMVSGMAALSAIVPLMVLKPG